MTEPRVRDEADKIFLITYKKEGLKRAIQKTLSWKKKVKYYLPTVLANKINGYKGCGKMKNKQIVYGTVINYATVFVQMISTVVVTPYLIKMFGDNDYGIYKIIVSLAAYLIILNFGVGNTLIRFCQN